MIIFEQITFCNPNEASTMNKKNVHKLTEITEESLIIFGISSHENDYRLSWALNEYLGFHFVKSQNHSIFNQKANVSQEFSVYTYTDNQEIIYRLLSNRCDNGFFLEEFRNIDFIFTIQPQEIEFNSSQLLAKIKTIPFVSTAFSINPSLLKNKKRLV